MKSGGFDWHVSERGCLVLFQGCRLRDSAFKARSCNISFPFFQPDSPLDSSNTRYHPQSSPNTSPAPSSIYLLPDKLEARPRKPSHIPRGKSNSRSNVRFHSAIQANFTNLHSTRGHYSLRLHLIGTPCIIYSRQMRSRILPLPERLDIPDFPNASADTKPRVHAP